MRSETGLTTKQERVLAALLTEVSIDLAAKKAGVSDTTIWRYLQIPAFRQAFLHARRQVVEESITLLQRSSKKAVATLVRNLDCGVPSTEVTAARTVLEQSFKGVELIELEERVHQLEEFQEEEKRRNSFS